MSSRTLQGYLPCVAEARARIAQRVEAVAKAPGDRIEMASFLIAFLCLRLGPLDKIPSWLSRSATACAATGQLELAESLIEAAALEQLHRHRIIEDLIGLRGVLGPVHLLAIAHPTRPDPRIERHRRARGLVPSQIPELVVSVDLELSELGAAFASHLLEAAHRFLGPDAPACLSFVDARVDNLAPRRALRARQLETILARQPELAPSFARVAITVAESFCGALEACLDYERVLAQRSSTLPTVEPSFPAGIFAGAEAPKQSRPLS